MLQSTSNVFDFLRAVRNFSLQTRLNGLGESKVMMVDRINDINWQARQGSVAAIIQVLNEQLADMGVRTRAVFADGVLQLLCEARTHESLEKSTLVPTIQKILQSLSPRHIYRVNINSRIVREQQLLWLEEISRDPENQLLWSEEILLEKPNPIQVFLQDFQQLKTELNQQVKKSNSLPVANSSRPIVTVKKNHNNVSQLLGWSIIVLSVCGVFGMIGWFGYLLWADKLKIAIQTQDTTAPTTSIDSTNQFLYRGNSPTSPIQKSTDDDYFADAVRIANHLSQQGKKATNKTQWLEIAANWQRASDLMAQVHPSHHRYQEAKIRTQLYREYSLEARKKADSFK